MKYAEFHFCIGKQFWGGYMNKAINLQDVFLNQVRKEKIPVTVYLTNGFQFKGIVRGFDTYSIIVDSEGKQELIFKHAVSTIMPIKPVHILDDNTQNT
jgi:host factor-I protein